MVHTWFKHFKPLIRLLFAKCDNDLLWIYCLTCDWIQNRIWTWTLLSLKIKHPFYLMVNFPLSNHHFQNAHLTNVTFIDIYEIPMYFEWNLGWKCENLISKWSPPLNLNYFNESHSSPVDPESRPTSYPFCLGILKLCNFCNHYTIFDYGKTQRLSWSAQNGWAWVVSDFGRDYGELFDKLKILTTLDNTQQSNV